MSNPAEAQPPTDSRADISKADAPTTGLWDTAKRRLASGPRTQREADVEAAEAREEWTPTEKESRLAHGSEPRDRSGVNPLGVVDEDMPFTQRA